MSRHRRRQPFPEYDADHPGARNLQQKGLHARASAKFVQTVEKFDADVRVTRGHETVGGTSIMGLMMLAAGPGDDYGRSERTGGDMVLDALAASWADGSPKRNKGLRLGPPHSPTAVRPAAGRRRNCGIPLLVGIVLDAQQERRVDGDKGRRPVGKLHHAPAQLRDGDGPPNRLRAAVAPSATMAVGFTIRRSRSARSCSARSRRHWGACAGGACRASRA